MLILSYENSFQLNVNENSFPYEKMSTRIRFEKEAKGNSEMAYCLPSHRQRSRPHYQIQPKKEIGMGAGSIEMRSAHCEDLN